MALQLTQRQLNILNSSDQLVELARWVIATSGQTKYAREVRETVNVRQTVQPGHQDVQRVMAYLASNKIDSGILARLINSFLQDR